MKKNTWRVRGITLGLIGCDELTIKNLEQQCRRLGMKTQIFTNFIDPAQFSEADALIFDSDNPSLCAEFSQLPWPELPKIALLGNETPSRLQWVIAQEIDGHMRKPVRYDGLLTAVSLALSHYQTRLALVTKLQKMEERIKARRFVFSAQLRLMQHLGLDENGSYERLRSLAMDQQKTVEQFSLELMSQQEPRLGQLIKK